MVTNPMMIFFSYFQAIAMFNSTIGSLLGTVMTPLLLFFMVRYPEKFIRRIFLLFSSEKVYHTVHVQFFEYLFHC